MEALDQGIDKVGIGIDLEGGKTTLALLRDIRAEMQGIASLGSRGSVTPDNAASSASRVVRDHEKEQIDSAKRVTEAKKKLNRDLSKDEIEIIARSKAKEMEQNAAIARRSKEIFAENEKKKTEELKKQLAERERLTRASAERVRNLAQQPNILQRANQNAKDRASFKAARNDPARGQLDNKFRSEIAEETRAIQYAQKYRAGEIRKAVDAASREDDILDRDLASARRRFKQSRNDPARGDLDNQWRQDLSIEMKGQRLARTRARQERARMDAEDAANERKVNQQRKTETRRAEIERRADDARMLGPDIADTRTKGLSRDLQRQREEFRRYRNDPARDDTTNRFRKELAKDIVDYRKTQRDQNEDNALDMAAQRIAKRRANDAEDRKVWEAEKAQKKIENDEKRRLFDEQMEIQARGFAIEDAQGQIVNKNKANVAKQNAVARLQVDQADSHIKDFKRIQNEMARNNLDLSTFGPQGLGTGGTGGRNRPRRPSGPGGGGPPRGPDFAQPKNLFNERGFFTSLDAVGRITRNILLYELVSNLSYGLIQMGGNAIQAAKDTVEYGNALRFASEQAGVTLESNEKLVESLRPVGLSRQQGRQAVTEATRFAEDQPQDIAALTNVVADIAAQRGGGIQQTDELIEQLRRRESKFYKRIFGTTVESIYEQDALKKIQDNPFLETGGFVPKDPYSPIGKKTNLLTQSEQVKQYIADMSDAQKEAAVLNFIIGQAPKFMGEAEKRAQTLAGRLDILNASILNGTEGFGLFITDLKITNDLIKALGDSFGALDDLRGPTIGRSGEGGFSTQADLDKYVQEKMYGPRAQSLNTVNSLLTTDNLAIGGGVIGAALLGRRQANQSLQLQTFNKEYPQALSRFGGNASAAQAEAVRIANQERAGFVRAVTTGFQRVTVGMTQGILNMTEAAASAVGAQGAAGRAALASARLTNPAAGRALIYNNPAIGTYGYQSYQQPVAAGGAYSPYPRLAGQYPYPTQFQTSNPLYSYKMDMADDATRARMERTQAGFGTAGGVAGGLAGITVASFIADSMQLGTLTATTLTIVGGVAGSAAGTAVGSAVGSAVAGFGGGRIATALGLGNLLKTPGGIGMLSAGTAGLLTGGAAVLGAASAYGYGSFVEDNITDDTPILGRLGLGRANAQKQGEKALAEITAGQAEWTRMAQQRSKAIEEGRLLFKLNEGVSYQGYDKVNLDANGNAVEKVINRFQGEIFTPTQVKELADKMGISVGEAIKKFTEVENPNLTARARYGLEEQKELENVRKQLLGADPSVIQKAEFKVRERYDYLRFHLLGYAEDYEKSMAAFQERELKARQDYINDLTSGLSKLRDLEQGSFQVVGNVASRVEQDNAFVAPFTDLYTLQERMKQQWGSLGDATVNYFKKLEQQAIKIQLIKLNFESLTKTVGLLNQAGREADEYFGPGQNTRQGLIGGLQGRLFQQADQNRDISTQRRRFLPNQYFRYDQTEEQRQQRENFYQVQDVRKQLSEYESIFREVSNIRGGDSVALRGAFGQQMMQLLGSIPEEILNTKTWYDGRTFRGELGGRFNNAARDSQELTRRDIQDEYKKIDLQEREQERVTFALREGQAKRDSLIRQGAGQPEIDMANRELNKYIISATDNIPLKDLTFEQFSQRNEALKQQASDEANSQERALQAAEAGANAQYMLLAEVGAIRAAILNGDLSLLIQIQNDAQARVDENNLESIGGGGYSVAKDRSKMNANPYGSQTKKNPTSKYGGMR